MVRKEKTEIAGPDGIWPDTSWTSLLSADQVKAVRDEILLKYWKPVYHYIWAMGHMCNWGLSNEDTKDLTQGFFYHACKKELLNKADRNRGRFRSLLRMAARNFVISELRKRGPRTEPLEFETEIPGDDGPEAEFDYQWARQLVDAVIVDLKSTYEREGKQLHWTVFQTRTLEPILNGTKAPSLAAICAQLGIESESKASNMVVTVKRRFRNTLLQHVERQMPADEDPQDELYDLIRILSRPSAG